jgi:hypothetical protein
VRFVGGEFAGPHERFTRRRGTRLYVRTRSSRHPKRERGNDAGPGLAGGGAQTVPVTSSGPAIERDEFSGASERKRRGASSEHPPVVPFDETDGEFIDFLVDEAVREWLTNSKG